jgi:hypothetical protein
MAERNEASRRVKVLIDYIEKTDTSILTAESKANITDWLLWFSEGKDSTTMMQWFPVIKAIFGHYIAALQERIDQKKFQVDRTAAQSRKALEKSSASKVTEAAAKAEALLYPGYEAARTELSALERLHGFLSSVNAGINPDLIMSFGHNQRLEMRQDT